MQIQFAGIDYALLVIYFAFILGIGWMLKRYVSGSSDFCVSCR